MTHDEAALIVCEAIDWNEAHLVDGKALAAQGKTMAAISSYLAGWRQQTGRKRPWSPAYVGEVRAAATEAQSQKAQAAVTQFLDSTIDMGRHDTFLAMADETLFLGIRDHETLARIGEKALAMSDKWPDSPWGCTSNQVMAVLRLLALPECRDEDLVPHLAWLATCSRTEWAWAKTWGEMMLGDSGHNWWLHTFRGFYVAGLHFPELAGLGQFRAFAATYFERELNLLMEADGFTRERSGYHWGTVSHWLSILHHVSCDTAAFPQWFHDKIRTVAETVWITALPYGGPPLWGDTSATYQPSLRAVLPAMAAALQLPEMKYVAQQLFPDWQPPSPGFLPGWGRNLWPDWQRLAAQAPALPTADTALPASRYYIMRTDWSPQADAIAFVAGPTGKTVCSHDHTHVGAFEMFVRGRPLLIDNGSGPYGDRPERMWRVGSAAHNTATVDELDHIPMVSEWRWANPIMPTLDAWLTRPSHAYCSIAHEGYMRLPELAVAARRKLFWLRGGYAILIDRFTVGGDAPHTYDIHFHLRGACEELAAERLVATEEDAKLLIVPVPGLSGKREVSACPYPVKGYENPTYLRYTETAAGNRIYVTLLVPFTGSCPAVDVRALDVNCDNRMLDPFEATALEITIDGQRDVYFDQHMHWNLPWQSGGYSGTQRLFHSRG